MFLLIFPVIAVLIMVLLHYVKGYSYSEMFVSNFFMLMAVGFLIRVLFASITVIHQTDYNCFTGWASLLYKDGFSNFYISDTFTDYPPGYMYVLYIIGFVSDVFKIDFKTSSHMLLIKLPAILADLGAAAFIYVLARKRTSAKTASQIALFYVLNPSVILISSVWGQVDSIHTLSIIASIYFLTEKKMLKAFLLFVVSFIIKPQSFMFTPVYMFYVWSYLSENKWCEKSIITFLKNVGISILAAVALLLPFAPIRGGFFDFKPIIEQYGETLSSYNHATVNAYNIYALFGKNWAPAADKFLGLTFTVWGIIALVLIVIFAIYMLKRCSNKSNYFFVSALIAVCTFMFSIKMHERYAFPAMALLLIAYIYKSNFNIKLLYGGISFAFFVNFLDVLIMTVDDYNYDRIKTTAVVFSVFTLLAFIYMIYTAFKAYGKGEGEEEEDGQLEPIIDIPEEEPLFTIESSSLRVPYTKKDFFVVAAITLVYGIVAFVNLGNMTSPQSMYNGAVGQEVKFEFGKGVVLSRVQYFLGARDTQKFDIQFTADGVSWTPNQEIEAVEVFSWNETKLNGMYATQAKITPKTKDFMLAEMAFRDEADNLVTPFVKADNAHAFALFDEQALVPKGKDYMNSTYFDEIYHPRTAYEFVKGLYVYEWTHPPLGKVIMSWGIKIFGMTPFGWRFMGTLLGVFMVPAIFLLARRMFKDTFWAAFVAIVFSFDFMHYAQTRLATIDTYITLFVIIMYYFMYKYYTMSFYDTKFRKTLIPLFFSGLFMGFGIASKWPGVYAGAGLAFIFLVTLFRRYTEYRHAINEGIEGEYRKFWRYTGLTCLCCIGFFILIPVIIYIVSYIPYYFNTGSLYPIRANNPFLKEYPFMQTLLPDNKIGNFIAAILETQRDMYEYHSKLSDPHVFSSRWFEWIFDIRPIYYFSNLVKDNVRQGISSFGNPLVWWAGFAAFLVCIYDTIVKRNRTAFFLVIAYLAQLLPWVFVTRTTYIYHYFPCVPFLVLMLGYFFKEKIRPEVHKKYAIAFMGVTVLLFALFYPVLSGVPVDVSYVEHALKWFFMPRWQLI